MNRCSLFDIKDRLRNLSWLSDPLE